MRKISASISLAGSQLGQTRHVCAFFNSDEEEYRVLLPFIKDGFERGTETYLQDGRFDQDRMLQSFEQMASGNAEGGFPLSRIVCRMDWVPDGQSHIDDLIEFEA